MERRTIYIRFRGRITGPFAEDEIHRMVERGQVSRMHEVSSDRHTWQRAGFLSKLFGDQTLHQASQSNQAAIDTAQAQAAEIFSQTESHRTHSNHSSNDALDSLVFGETKAAHQPPQNQTNQADSIWYYALDDREIGPIKQHQIMRLVERGALDADTLVWQEGMPQWSTLADSDLAQYMP